MLSYLGFLSEHTHRIRTNYLSEKINKEIKAHSYCRHISFRTSKDPYLVETVCVNQKRGMVCCYTLHRQTFSFFFEKENIEKYHYPKETIEQLLQVIDSDFRAWGSGII